jgi:hypothetical protein
MSGDKTSRLLALAVQKWEGTAHLTPKQRQKLFGKVRGFARHRARQASATELGGDR